MNRATPPTRELAGCLIAFETQKLTFPDTSVSGAFRVCERLRPHLATYMGSAGFRALLSRALALAGAEVPWLRLVQVKADGSLGGLERLETQVDPKELTEGGLVLVAQVLALLMAFVGEDLTLQLVREVWLQLPAADFKLGEGDTK